MAFHSDVAWNASKRIERALEVLHKLEREAIDIRPEVRARILKFEALRDTVESLWMAASGLRVELQSADGCTGRCKEK